MELSPIPPNEAQRLEALLELGILDTQTEERFDLITKMVERYFQTKMVRITFVDKDRVWFKSKIGLKSQQAPRNTSFCGHAVTADGILEVCDTLQDPRFSDNPVVSGGPKIRFYAGVPIVHRGYVVGTLCLNHNQPKTLTPTERDMLLDFGKLVENELTRIEKDLYRELKSTHLVLAETIPLGILVTDADLRISYLNTACTKLFGYSQDAMMSMNLLDFAVNQSQAAHQAVHAWMAAGKPPKRLHIKCNTASDREIYCRLYWSYRYTSDRKIKGMVFAVTDITHDRLRKKELIAARREADSANHAKSQFLAHMSHELRTPLNAILGMSQLLTMYPEELNESQQELMSKIHNSGQHLLSIIDDILDLASIEAGHLELHRESINLEMLLGQLVDIIEMQATQKSITIDFPNKKFKDLHVLADDVRLKQVILNLLSNAVKYNHQNGQLSLELKSVEEATCTLAVTNTGKGIPLERMDELFEPFNRLGAEKTATRGTGIGLTISKRLIESMDGRISCISTPGEGCSFEITLPLAQREQAGIVEKTLPDSEQSGQTIQPVEVLYIEDDAINQLLMRKAVGLRPYMHLTVVETGQEGLKRADESPPDIILLDIGLPEMDGWEVMDHLKANPRTQEIPVIAVTAYAGSREIQTAIEAGFVHYLTKPLDITELLNLIDYHAQTGQ